MIGPLSSYAIEKWNMATRITGVGDGIWGVLRYPTTKNS